MHDQMARRVVACRCATEIAHDPLIAPKPLLPRPRTLLEQQQHDAAPATQNSLLNHSMEELVAHATSSPPSAGYVVAPARPDLPAAAPQRGKRRRRRAAAQQPAVQLPPAHQASWKAPGQLAEVQPHLQGAQSAPMDLDSSLPTSQPLPWQHNLQSQHHCQQQQQHQQQDGTETPAFTPVHYWLRQSSRRCSTGLRGRLKEEVASSGLAVAPLEAFPGSVELPAPIAPQDPAELLQVIREMPPPRRRLVIFKAGGYIYSDMEALLQQSGLARVARLTNLIRKAGCVLARPRWDNGKRVNLSQHQAAAASARVPFLVLTRLDALELAGLLRPLLVKKGILAEAMVYGAGWSGSGTRAAAGPGRHGQGRTMHSRLRRRAAMRGSVDDVGRMPQQKLQEE